MRRLIASPGVLVLTGLGLVAATGPTQAKVPGSNGQIVFARSDPAIDNSHIFTVNPDGTYEEQLLGTFAQIPIGRLTAAGSAMICCDFGLAPTIINADGSDSPSSPSRPGSQSAAATSGPSDGSRLACGFGDFDPPQPERDGIYTLRASDGGDPVQVTTQPGEDGADDYSPDGSRIVFSRSITARPGRTQTALFVVNVDGSGLRRLTSWGLGGFRASWSPDGRWIAFDYDCRSGWCIRTVADFRRSRSTQVAGRTGLGNLSGRPMEP